MKIQIVSVTEVFERQYVVALPEDTALSDEEILQHCEEYGTRCKNDRVHIEVHGAQDDDQSSP